MSRQGCARREPRPCSQAPELASTPVIRDNSRHARGSSSRLVHATAARNAALAITRATTWSPVLTGYQTHCNTARPHQGIAQHVPDAHRDAPRATVTEIDTGRIHRRSVLGGLINEYTHAA